MPDRRLVAILGTVSLVAVTQGLAVLLADPFLASGLVLAGAGETAAGAGTGGSAGGAGGVGSADRPTPGGAGLYGLLPVVLGMALGTLLVLAVARFDLDARVVRVVLLSSLVAAVGFVLLAVLPLPVWGAGALAVAVASVVWVHPEWYVINAVAVVAVAGVTALLGVSLSPGTAILVLVAMAAYDAYSVYGSGHMLDLASTSASLGAPTMFVVPTQRGTSTRDLDGVDPDGGGEGATVAMLGAGDALFPGVLVVSALAVGDPVLGPFSLPALGAFAGSITGLIALQVYVHRVSGLHAGLPPLNAAAILGYVGGVLAAGLSLAEAVGL